MDAFKHYFTNWKTVPNLLSFLRIVMVPVFGVLFYHDHLIAALLVLVASGVTDFLDGKIARRFNQVSELGKMLDPVADKLTMITLAILMFLEFHKCESSLMKACSWIFFVFLAKEFVFVVGGAAMIAFGIIPGAAEIYGKIATFVFYTIMVVLFLFGPEVGVVARHIPAAVLPDWACVALVSVSALLTIIAFISYMPDTYRQVQARFSPEGKAAYAAAKAEKKAKSGK